MVLIVNGSSSTGNSYALVSSSGEILLIEAGIKPKVINRAIDFKMYNVVACISSHEHNDHSKYLNELAKTGITVFCNASTAKAKDIPKHNLVIAEGGRTEHFGEYSVTPFEVKHDVPCLGFIIRHPESGIMLFATDTFQIPMALTGINHFLIEANYSDAIIKDNFKQGKIDKHQVDRIMLSHMSLDYCVKYLRDCQADRTARTITLCHLSERNSDPKQFYETVAGAFGVPTFVAKRNTIINLV